MPFFVRQPVFALLLQEAGEQLRYEVAVLKEDREKHAQYPRVYTKDQRVTAVYQRTVRALHKQGRRPSKDLLRTVGKLFT